jgi:hypothetical protein
LRTGKAILAAAVAASKEFMALKPGQETEFVSELKVPKNADIKKITATLLVSEELDELKSDTAHMKITKDAASIEPEQHAYDIRLELPNRPRNVEIKLAGGSVFWTFSGILNEESYELSDFAQHANEFLNKAQFEDEQVNARFIVKSDTAGRIKIVIDDEKLVYTLIQTKAWQNDLDETVRLDRNLQMDYCTIQKIPLQPVAGSQEARKHLKAVHLDIGGQFEQLRLLGSVSSLIPSEFCTISNEFSLCQCFIPDRAIKLTGLTGYFQVDTGAEFYLEIQADSANAPSARAPLVKANFALPGSSKNWTSIMFENAVELKENIKYWIVLKGIRGKVWLGLESQPAGSLERLLLNRGGQLWKEIPAVSGLLAGMLRLIYLPDVDNQSAALELGMDNAAQSQRVDPNNTAQGISIECENLELTDPVLVIKSFARGNICIGNIVQEYLQ